MPVAALPQDTTITGRDFLPVAQALVSSNGFWAFLIALLIALLFRRDIRSLLARVLKVAGLEFDKPRLQEASAENPTSGETIAETLTPLGQTARQKSAPEPVELRAKEALSWLDKVGVPEAEREIELARLFGLAEMNRKFEMVYGMIFGSQLRLLDSLNVAPRAESNILDDFKRLSRKDEVLAGYGFENWLKFLTGVGLVHRTVTQLVLTNEGREFLKFIPFRRYTLQKDH